MPNEINAPVLPFTDLMRPYTDNLLPLDYVLAATKHQEEKGISLDHREELLDAAVLPPKSHTTEHEKWVKSLSKNTVTEEQASMATKAMQTFAAAAAVILSVIAIPAKLIMN
ncbi:MAG: hypothetical protein AAF153_02815, partial [Pseudomonadota bacterium]